jgi:glycosyltransferase involved in cell wall biosynthesis
VIAAPPGVSFVVPVLNGRRWLRAVMESIDAQQDGRPFEIIAVDDGSTDGSLRLLTEWERIGRLRVIRSAGRGAAAAINVGIREARHPIICQVDQDVILRPGWMTPLVSALAPADVAAAQGHYVTASGAGFWARATGRDLELRYARIDVRYVDHVCTGNTVYRAAALHQVGLLDERLGYGYDNDLSYRLSRQGYRLAFCRDAVSVHRWREGFRGYVGQQFGVGYGRLDVVARHPSRVRGDDVSGIMMMLHGPAMLAALAAVACGIAIAWTTVAVVGLTIIAILAGERVVAGIAACRKTRDLAALAFVVTHLVRDVVWAAAILLWIGRRIWRLDSRPAHSMRRHLRGRPSPDETRGNIHPGMLLAIVPVFNEAANLPRVIAELRTVAPECDLLVVNDGSTDTTEALLRSLPVRWLTMSQRVGVGGAVRAGIRYANRAGYEYVVRIDGDGQHRARDIARLLLPVACGRADVSTGSRFLGRAGLRVGLRRASQAALATCLTVLTGRRVTDPTSGFWLFGPRAVRLLARHHPTGYAEPELTLLLSRNGLRVQEVPIRVRPRLAGRTSLTAPRAVLALARTVLALVVVPLRRVVEGQPGD